MLGKVCEQRGCRSNTLLQTLRFTLGRKSPGSPGQSSALQSLLPELIHYLWATVFYRWAVVVCHGRTNQLAGPWSFLSGCFFKIVIPSRQTAAISNFCSLNKARREFSLKAEMED